jgi:hypothetical protein
MEPREVTGHFWTPDVSPERAVGGILRFSPRDGVRLELLDSIRADISDRLIGDLGEEVDVILGATHGGKEVTLVRCWALHSSSSAPWVVPRVVYRADVAYVGAHLVEETDRAFTTATLTFDTLDDLVSENNFETDWPAGGSGESSATWHPPAEHVAHVDGEATVVLDASLNWKEDRRGISMSERYRLTVDLAEKQPFQELQNRFTYPLQNPISLMVGFPFVLERLVVQSPAAPEPNHPTYLMPIEVMYSPLSDEAPSLDRVQPILRLWDCGIGFESLVPRWLALCREEDLGPVVNVFFGIQYRVPGFVELRFLMLAIALESCHERRFPDRTAEPSEEFDERVAAIMDAVSESSDVRSADRRWLKGKLKRANDPWLEHRYLDIIEACRAYLPDQVDDIQKVAKRLTDTRNHLAHGSTRIGDALTDRDRFWGEQFLRILISTVLFRELGLPAEKVSHAWSRNRFYK